MYFLMKKKNVFVRHHKHTRDTPTRLFFSFAFSQTLQIIQWMTPLVAILSINWVHVTTFKQVILFYFLMIITPVSQF